MAVLCETQTTGLTRRGELLVKIGPVGLAGVSFLAQARGRARARAEWMGTSGLKASRSSSYGKHWSKVGKTGRLLS